MACAGGFRDVRAMADEAKGPRVFSYLADDESSWISEADRDALALRRRLRH